MSERLYSEDQVAEIVRRAAQIQENRAKDVYAPGVTHAELQRIAHEIGLSDEALQQALDEIRSNPVKFSSGLFGTLNIDEVVEGELRPEDFDVAAETLPLGSQGSLVTQVGKSMRSTQMVGGHSVTTQITARDGRTRVRIKSVPVLPLVLGIEAVVFGLIFGIPLTLTNNPAVGLPLLFGLTGLGSGLLWYGATKGKQKVIDYAQKLVNNISRVTAPAETVSRDRLSQPVASEDAEDPVRDSE